MPINSILNVKTPSATTSGAFGFVLQTTPLPLRKERDNAYLHHFTV